MKIKQLYIKGMHVVIGDGQHTYFWQDTLCGDKPLSEQFPKLLLICNETIRTVKPMDECGWRLTFRRWFFFWIVNFHYSSNVQITVRIT